MQSFLLFMLTYMAQFWSNPFTAISNLVKFDLPSGFSRSLGNLFDAEYDLVNAGGGLQDVYETFVDPSGAVYTTLWTKVQPVYTALASIGMALLLFYYVLGIADKLTKDRLTGYELLRSGIELIVAMMFVVEGFNMFQGLMDFSQGIYSEVSKTVSTTEWKTGDRQYELFFKSSNYGGKDVKDWTDDLSWDVGKDGSTTSKNSSKVHGWDGLAGMLIPVIEVCLMALVSQIGCLIGVAQLVSRVIQMAVYVIMAPLATADMFNGGIMNSAGFRYLKKFLAICLQGVIIYVIIYATRVLQTSLLSANTTLTSNPFFVLVPGLIMVTLVLKSQQFANDIMGV